MAVKIVLGEDFENDKAGIPITVTNRKLKRIIDAGIPYTRRLTAGTSIREYTFEKPIKEEEE